MASKKVKSEILSRYISRSLILSGLGRYTTKLFKTRTLMTEQLAKIFACKRIEVFEMGSATECTETPDSDVDRMIVVPGICVVLKPSVVNKYDLEGECDIIFLLDTSKSNQGYARLRLLKNTSKGHSIFDDFKISLQDVLAETKEGNFLSSEKFINFFVSDQNQLDLPTKCFRNGPCATTEYVYIKEMPTDKLSVSKQTDMSHAIACCEWPDEAKGWITRKHPHNWPQQSVVESIRQKRCHVVPIGDPQSEHTSLEWRVSYNLSERELVWSFNDTQLHCYFLLKKLLKLFLETIAPDQLSSYNMKTLVFQLSEEKGLSMWYAENLISCLEESLDKLYDCVKHKKLQHYFNCHANLFGHKFQNDVQREKMLEKIFEIRTNIAPFLFKCLPPPWEWPGLWKMGSSEPFDLAKISRCYDDYRHLETLFKTCKQDTEEFCRYRVLFNVLIKVTSNYKEPYIVLNQLMAFKKDQLDGADSLIVKRTKIYLKFRFAMAYFREMKTGEDEYFHQYICFNFLTEDDMIKKVSNTCKIDEMSGGLYLATVYHLLGDHTKSSKTVNDLLRKRMHLIYTGYCSRYKSIYLTRGGFAKQDLRVAIYGSEGTTYPAYDVIFSNRDIYCVPDPVKFECAISEFENGANNVVVHPCVYAYFLLCYVQYKSNDFASFRNTLKYLEKAVNETKGGFMRHHALNILSCCYILDGNLHKAFEYFTESCLETKKQEIVWNAAAIHIALLIVKRLGQKKT